MMPTRSSRVRDSERSNSRRDKKKKDKELDTISHLDEKHLEDDQAIQTMPLPSGN